MAIRHTGPKTRPDANCARSSTAAQKRGTIGVHASEGCEKVMRAWFKASRYRLIGLATTRQCERWIGPRRCVAATGVVGGFSQLTCLARERGLLGLAWW